MSDAGRRLENDAGGRRMRDAGVRLGFLYPGGGAEQDYYLFGEEVHDRVRMFLVGTRVGGGRDDDHSVAALLRTAEVELVGKTVLTANQVTIWEALRLAGSSLTVADHGRLLATAPSEMLR
jgi:hypothetical protein